MSTSDVPVSPAKKICTSSQQESRETTQASSVLPSKEMESRLLGVSIIPLSSASSANSDEELKKTNCLEDLKKGVVSTTLCLYDETWLCRNADYPNVSCTPRKENLTEQTRKIKEMKEDEEQYETGPWSIKKELNTTDIWRQLRLRKADVECHILRYLSEDDQKKLVQGDSITINMYDQESDTTHKVLLMRWVSKTNYYCLKNIWRKDYVHRKGLRVGDKIGLSWDRFHYKLHFLVLSRATTKAPAEEKKRAEISTERTLYTWTIEKTLAESDVNHITRLMLGKSDAEGHIMRHLSTDVQQTILKGKKFKVKAYDHDTDTEHDMVFLRYVKTTNNYVFNRGWAKEFVRRRDLKQGYKIGLFWGNVDSRLHFCVLHRTIN